MVVVRCLFIGVAAIGVLLDWDGLSARMPTQVPPRRLAAVPLALGIVLVVLGVAK